MSQKLRSSVVALLLLATPVVVRAQVLTFEGLTGANVPEGYGGFSWLDVGGLASSWGLAADFAGGGTNVSRPVSGVQNTFSNGGSSMQVSLDGTFDLVTAYMSAVNGFCGIPGSPITQVVHGFLGATELFTKTIGLSCTTMEQETFDFVGVDHVIFDQIVEGKTNVLVDDFQVANVDPRFVGPTAAPEPASIALVATGLIGIGGIARRRRSMSK
jgi:hypothetical protein